MPTLEIVAHRPEGRMQFLPWLLGKSKYQGVGSEGKRGNVETRGRHLGQTLSLDVRHSSTLRFCLPTRVARRNMFRLCALGYCFFLLVLPSCFIFRGRRPAKVMRDGERMNDTREAGVYSVHSWSIILCFRFLSLRLAGQATKFSKENFFKEEFV